MLEEEKLTLILDRNVVGLIVQSLKKLPMDQVEGIVIDIATQANRQIEEKDAIQRGANAALGQSAGASNG